MYEMRRRGKQVCASALEPTVSTGVRFENLSAWGDVGPSTAFIGPPKKKKGALGAPGRNFLRGNYSLNLGFAEVVFG